MSALIHKKRTGEGQYIDLSQYESAIHFLGASFLDGTANGRVEGPVGNDLTVSGSRSFAPHGVYRCASASGVEQFVALAAFDDVQWERLVEMTQVPELSDARFSSNQRRCELASEIDSKLEVWTKGQQAKPLVERLWAVGIPAGIVQTPPELDADPQLRHRGHSVTVPHSEMEEIVVDMPGVRVEPPARPMRAGPCLGEDNEYVYQQLLGYSPEEYYEMLAFGVVELWEH
jgi:benzylsuccinate CoA-transferase BbsF subunit